MEKKEAIKILKEFHDKSAIFSVRTALDTVIPELKESEDERIRKNIIEHLQYDIDDMAKSDNPFDCEAEIEELSKYIAWLEKQDNTNIEQVFRPLAGCCIDTAARQAVEQQKQGKNVVLAFNGFYIPVKNNTTDTIVNEYYSWVEKQTEISPILSNSSNIGKNKHKCSWREEDERIRKEIISFITDRKNWFPKEETKSSWISWLEKQGEQKSIDNIKK